MEGLATPTINLEISIESIKKVTCCQAFGKRGLSLMFLLLALAILHFVLFYTYSSSFGKPFVKMNRVAQGLWIFALCCFVSLGLFIYYCARWYQISQSWIQKRRNDDDDDKEEEQKNCCISLYNTYDSNFGINGKYYLIVLVFFECFC